MTEPTLLTRVRLLPELGAHIDGLADVELADGVITHVRPSLGARGDVDADGAVLLPGLWDAHVHFSTHALISRATPLPDTGPVDAVLAAVREATASPGPIVGFGFRAGLWERPPTAAQLDAVTTQPVALIGADLHSVWANRAGLALLGRADHPTGLLLEGDAFAAITHLMATEHRLLDRAVAGAAREAARRGIVGIVDLELDWPVDAWRRRADAGPLPLRVVAGTYPGDLDRALAAGLRTGDRVADGVVVGPLKLIADGSMGSRTAQCRHPYPHPLPGLPHGQANYSDAELRDLLHRATTGGLDVAVHAIGDLALARALDAVEATGARGSIEHVQFATPADLARMASLGLVASIQPAHLTADQDLLDDVWPAAGPSAFPWRSMVTAGIPLALGSDAPVAPLDPWLALDAATRRTHHPEQALAPMEALDASVRSRVDIGEPADLVLVDRTPPALRAGRFAETRVIATLIAGRRVP